MTEEREVVSPSDVGALVRRERQAAGLTQQALAEQAGTTRQWLIRLEQGQPGAATGKLLDVLSVLGLEMLARHDLPPNTPRQPRNAAERRIAELLSGL